MFFSETHQQQLQIKHDNVDIGPAP